jgi:gas vesicle protein
MRGRTIMKRNASSVWPYIVVGSAVGGTLGYLFGTESGRKMRYCITHPKEFGDNLEDARAVFESKARTVSDKVRGVLDKAKTSMEAGKRAFQEASEDYQSRFRTIETKNEGIHRGIRTFLGRRGELKEFAAR